MKIFITGCVRHSLLFVCMALAMQRLTAQTDIDGVMMSKNNLCTGFMYSYSSWKDYWEGTYKRDNENLGTVSTQMIGFMGNYGISNRLNVIYSLPYVITKASAGTMDGLRGIQDLSLWLKWRPVEHKIGKGRLSLFGVAGVSLPVSNYVADYLPLSIGLRSKTLSLRAIGDYQVGRCFVTASGTYVLRDNIKIDRDAYYTTEMHYTNEVKMPDAVSFNFRAGYRYSNFTAEAILNNWTTLGGFDITKNNMPFPSNEMNATAAGINLKYEVAAVPGLSVTGGGNYVIAGRNVGQATGFNAGIFYVFGFAKKSTGSSVQTNN